MASRIAPVTIETATDPDLKQLLQEGAEGWWKDAEMFGVIGRVPDLLKSVGDGVQGRVDVLAAFRLTAAPEAGVRPRCRRGGRRPA